MGGASCLTQPPFVVVLEGLEPSLAEPESDVLPLHHKTISQDVALASAWGCRPLFYRCKVSGFLGIDKIFGHYFWIYFVINWISTDYNQYGVMQGGRVSILAACVVWCAVPAGLWFGRMYITG